MFKSTIKNGFTLLELLLTFAIIGVLATITIKSLNPKKHLAETQNARRKSEILTIVNAIQQYSIDNIGILPGNITFDERVICRSNMATATCDAANAVDLRVLTDNEIYLVAIPFDPVGQTASTTGYFIKRTGNSQVQIRAPFAELGEVIKVTR